MLTVEPRRIPPIIPYGPVITSIQDMYALKMQQRLGNYELVKVVTGWGLTWTPQSIAEIMRTFKYVIIRTVAGDPSTSGNRLPQYKDVLQEVVAWIAGATDQNILFIEVGNEPNIIHDRQYFYDYQYHLTDCYTQLHTRYPNVFFIAAGISCNPLHLPAGREYTLIAAQAARLYDYQAIHAYETSSFTKDILPRTGELNVAISLYAWDVKLALTEFGLNNTAIPMEDRENEYRRLCNSSIKSRVWAAAYYHIATMAHTADQKQYHVVLE